MRIYGKTMPSKLSCLLTKEASPRRIGIKTRHLSQSLKKVIGLIPGDGVGKDVIPAAHRVLEKVAPEKFEYLYLDAGFDCFLKTGNALPDENLKLLKEKCCGALFGATQSPLTKVEGYRSPIIQLRNKFDLYANVRPITIVAPDKPYIDMVIVREGTECVYIKKEWMNKDENGLDVAWALRKISNSKSMKVGKFALDLALKRHESRKRGGASAFERTPLVTIVHKSNVLTVTDGLFRRSVKEVYQSNSMYSGIKIEDQIVDSMLYKLIKDPSHFDVVVCPNLYGDLVSDCGAALMGSLGLAASANIGDDFVLCEPVHGSAPDIAGKCIANPLASIRSAALLMEHIGETQTAIKINKSVNEFLLSGCSATPDLGGNKTTNEVTDSICNFLDSTIDKL